MTKTLITTSALAALLAASALTPAFAQTREAADQTQGDRTGGAYVDDLIIGAAPARAGASNGGGLHVTSPATAASEFARTLTPNSGGSEQANTVMPHHTTLDDLRPAAEAAQAGAEWSRVSNKAVGHAAAEEADSDNKRLQRRVRAQQEEPAALLLPAVQSAREAARRSNCAASSSTAGVVDDGLDTDSDGCGAAMQSGRGRARARATVDATAGQEGGGLWNGTGPAAASDQGGGGIFNNGGVIGAAARGGDTLDDCDEVNSNPTTATSSGGDHTGWIELDSTHAAARCGDGDGDIEVDTPSEITIMRSAVRRGMQDLKN